VRAFLVDLCEVARQQFLLACRAKHLARPYQSFLACQVTCKISDGVEFTKDDVEGHVVEHVHVTASSIYLTDGEWVGVVSVSNNVGTK
jgi:hypothetical protein